MAAAPEDPFWKQLLWRKIEVPGWAKKFREFKGMWNGTSYTKYDKMSIYVAVMVALSRRVQQICPQNLSPIELEMALGQFLSSWLQWGTAQADSPELMSLETSVGRTAVEPDEIFSYGDNSEFFLRIRELTDEECIGFMRKAHMQTGKRALGGDSTVSKTPKPTAGDDEKVKEGLAASDSLVIGDLRSSSVQSHISEARNLKIYPGKANQRDPTDVEVYNFLLKDHVVRVLMTQGFRDTIAVEGASFLQYHMRTAKMRAVDLLVAYGCKDEMTTNMTQPKFIDYAMRFKKDKDGNFWMSSYPQVLLGRRASTGEQRFPILGCEADLTEVYRRVFEFMAVLHGWSVFGPRVWKAFLPWFKNFFDNGALNPAELFCGFHNKVFVTLADSLQEISHRFYGDTGRNSPFISVIPLFGIHGSVMPKDAGGEEYSVVQQAYFQRCHLRYTTIFAGKSCGGTLFWGIKQGVVPSAKNSWNSLPIDKSFQTSYAMPLMNGALGATVVGMGALAPAPAPSPAPASAPTPNWAAIDTGTLQEPIVLDGAGSAKKKPEKTAISWVDAEWISLDDHLKQTYGLTGPRNAAPGFACRQNIREVMYPGFFPRVWTQGQVHDVACK